MSAQDGERRAVLVGEFGVSFLPPACRWRSQPLVSAFLCQQGLAVTLGDHFTPV